MRTPTTTTLRTSDSRVRTAWRTWAPLVAAGVLLATVLGLLAVFVAPNIKPIGCGTAENRFANFATCSVPLISKVGSGLTEGTGTQHRATNAAVTTTDPGQAVSAYLNAHGAHTDATYAAAIDTAHNHALICHEYAIRYANEPAGARDQWGVTVPLAEAAISATGFCS